MEHVFRNWVHIVPSRSSKVVDFGTNQKRVWDFLFVFNSNLCPAKKIYQSFCLRKATFFHTPPLFQPKFRGVRVPVGVRSNDISLKFLGYITVPSHVSITSFQHKKIGLDCAVFYVPANTVQVIMGDGFVRSKDPTNSIKVLKEKAAAQQEQSLISKLEVTKNFLGYSY